MFSFFFFTFITFTSTIHLVTFNLRCKNILIALHTPTIVTFYRPEQIFAAVCALFFLSFISAESLVLFMAGLFPISCSDIQQNSFFFCFSPLEHKNVPSQFNVI